jgi:hypothetical protein
MSSKISVFTLSVMFSAIFASSAFAAESAGEGRNGDAQTYRWKSYFQSLNTTRLKAFLKRLPDFDDVEAEEHALTHALTYPSVHQALLFLTSWPPSNRRQN